MSVDAEQELFTASTSPRVLGAAPEPLSSPSTSDENDKHSYTIEDSIIAGLESICGLFDNVYLFKSLGIISENNFLYRRLNKGEWGSRLWFVTLLLSARKSISHLIKIVRARSKLTREMREMKIEDDDDLVKQVLKNKFTDALKKYGILIRDVIFELLQTFSYLAIVTIEVFKFSVNARVLRILEPLSHFIAVLRIFSSGYNTLAV
ncbi:PEX34 (YCL056C) [Zygosaccharomyces parabailii]|nr:PEX34 (YCL056C) [Zygosaccharomyces parabailii]CDH09842.1 uncharacterized protein ZBAI_01626 [Zygosaccharomyces bailii ISA1307]